MTRRGLTLKDKLEVLVRQAVCPRCGGRLGELAGAEFHHMHELVLGGPDTADNLVAMHVDCHKVETNGTKATTYGSTKHEAAKVVRLQKRRLGIERKAFKRPWPSRPFPKRAKAWPTKT